MTKRLIFFTSFSGSLAKWRREAILDREILHLKAFIEQGTFETISIFSYHDEDDAILAALRRKDAHFDAVHLLLPTRRLFRTRLLGPLLFSLIGPIIHRSAIRQADLIKTNQISGSWSALIAKLISGRPLLLRFGYILSRRHTMNGKRVAAAVSRILEWACFRAANAIVVTSELARKEVELRSGAPRKVHLIPTYIDTLLFHKKQDYDFDTPVLYVGRFTPQKNLLNLIQACAKANFALHLIGAGDQETELRAACADRGVAVRFLGRIANTELAEIIRRYTYFALPSLHEGLPKVLLEAMASGLICIGTDIPGTSDLVCDGETGYLAPATTAESLASTLTRARAEKNTALGENACAFIKSKFGLGRYIASESLIISAVLDNDRLKHVIEAKNL